MRCEWREGETREMRWRKGEKGKYEGDEMRKEMRKMR